MYLKVYFVQVASLLSYVTVFILGLIKSILKLQNIEGSIWT